MTEVGSPNMARRLGFKESAPTKGVLPSCNISQLDVQEGIFPPGWLNHLSWLLSFLTGSDPHPGHSVLLGLFTGQRLQSSLFSCQHLGPLQNQAALSQHHHLWLFTCNFLRLKVAAAIVAIQISHPCCYGTTPLREQYGVIWLPFPHLQWSYVWDTASKTTEPL